MASKDDDLCRAVWYWGDPRDKHICYRPKGHRRGHHSDAGLSWARDPHHRRASIDLQQPCPDCGNRPEMTGYQARKVQP
jgi:hypothetical protein